MLSQPLRYREHLRRQLIRFFTTKVTKITKEEKRGERRKEGRAELLRGTMGGMAGADSHPCSFLLILSYSSLLRDLRVLSG